MSRSLQATGGAARLTARPQLASSHVGVLSQRGNRRISRRNPCLEPPTSGYLAVAVCIVCHAVAHEFRVTRRRVRYRDTLLQVCGKGGSAT